MALVREHLQRRYERMVMATLGGHSQITRARLLRDFVERPWARLNIRGVADVPETNKKANTWLFKSNPTNQGVVGSSPAGRAK